MDDNCSHSTAFDELVRIMARLRDPEKGCPWDLKQNFKTIAPYTLEEAYEVADAIESNNLNTLCAELGDLLLQVIFHAQMASEQKLFDISDVCRSINDKMTRRHPHIFAEETLETADDVSRRWDEIKTHERGEVTKDPSHLHDIAKALPALKRAQKLQRRAAHVGFDWSDITGVWDKLAEEQTELHEECQSGDQQRIEEEMGDMLFTCVNLSRHLDVNPEQALRDSNLKFISRFNVVEQLLQADDRLMDDCSVEELEDYWQKAKSLISTDERR